MGKIILGIETSCDETAAAVVQKEGESIQILSNVVASSAKLQAKYGGIIPEQAAREQLKTIIPVITEALKQAKLKPEELSALAVTQGPGLIGSLLVGVETVKTLALTWDKKIIPVNHLIGHFYANFIVNSSDLIVHRKKTDLSTNNEQPTMNTIPKFPCLGLLVSGGHTDLVLFLNHGRYDYIGGTRDDAAGECFDKCARLLNLPYPGGPNLSKIAEKGNPKSFNLPRPMMDSDDLDFSFSGLKTAVSNLLREVGFEPVKAIGTVELHSKPGIKFRHGAKQTNSERSGSGALRPNKPTVSDLAASIEQAIVDVLVFKTLKAAKYFKVKEVLVAGGVSANKRLRGELETKLAGLGVKLFIPPPQLCTDNAAMIAAAAFFQKPIDNPLSLQANPNLSLAY